MEKLGGALEAPVVDDIAAAKSVVIARKCSRTPVFAGIATAKCGGGRVAPDGSRRRGSLDSDGALAPDPRKLAPRAGGTIVFGGAIALVTMSAHLAEVSGRVGPSVLATERLDRFRRSDRRAA